MKIQVSPITPWVDIRKLCEEAVYAATATQEGALKEKKRKEWLHYPGWKFDIRLVCGHEGGHTCTNAIQRCLG
jgi:hypothetical protein